MQLGCLVCSLDHPHPLPRLMQHFLNISVQPKNRNCFLRRPFAHYNSTSGTMFWSDFGGRT